MNQLVTIILAAELFCAAPSVVNKSPYKLNNRDRYESVQASISCQERYPASPCLKCFWKTGPQNWLVVCARKSEKFKELTNNEVECEEIWESFEKLRKKD